MQLITTVIKIKIVIFLSGSLNWYCLYKIIYCIEKVNKYEIKYEIINASVVIKGNNNIRISLIICTINDNKKTLLA